jgi:hypothetical protein
MWSIRVVLEIPGSTDPVPLRNFGDSIFMNPIYTDVILGIKERQGFVRKTSTIVEKVDRCYAISDVVFDTKENFDLYYDDQSVKNMWEYFIMFANENGISTTLEIVETNLDI